METSMTIEQANYLIDNGYESYKAKYEPNGVNQEVIEINEQEMYEYLDEMVLMTVNDLDNLHKDTIDPKVQEAKDFAANAKMWKEFKAWDMMNKNKSKQPIDRPKAKPCGMSTDEMLYNYNRFC